MKSYCPLDAMRRRPIGFGGLALALATACGSPLPSAPPCEESSLVPCDMVRARRCNSARNAVEWCGPDSQGCLVWHPDRTCGARQQCVEEAPGQVQCLCLDECDRHAPNVCQGNHISTCTVNLQGCRVWQSIVDCARSGQACDESGPEPLCVDRCDTSCPAAEATRCQGDVVQRCQFVDDCFVWTDEDDCHNEGLRCAILQDQARCHCRDGCEIGDRRCSESTQTIEHCIVGSDGCRRWSEVSRCHERGRVCATTEARPVCACPEQCPLGVTRCAENTLQVCSLTEYSCATWLDVAEQTDGGLDSGTTCANEDCGDGSACPSSTDGGSLDQAS